MQAVILAAGRGSRMGEFTKDMPKPLLPVGEKTVIEYTLDILSRGGVTHVIIVVGYKGDLVEKAIGNQYGNSLITYIYNHSFSSSDNLYSLWLARKCITQGMIFLNGDTLFHKNILLNLIKHSHPDVIAVDTIRAREENPIVFHVENGRLVEIGHTISREIHGVVSGVYKISEKTTTSYFQEAEKFFTQGPKRGGFTVPIQQLASRADFRTVDCGISQWVNINTPDDYERAKKMIKNISQPSG